MTSAELKASILDRAVRGLLTATWRTTHPSHPSSPASDPPFPIPDSWEWVRLGEVCHIERGGSPRPISAYITSAANGINWIKIGDTEQGGKYILSATEKIKPEGLNKTRLVEPGDFLLTNSMSFGRPYICKIHGAIHDGWLRLHFAEHVFDELFLFWLLSSPFVFRQFDFLASGSSVRNLKIDKAAIVKIPLPPLAEQREIVARVEELLKLVEQMKG